jgi:hypothetical protein
MFQDKPAWIEHQRKRWMKPNAHLWMRPDAHRWLQPNQKLWRGPQTQSQERKAGSEGDIETRDFTTAIQELLSLQSQLVALKFELKFRRLLRSLKYGYNPGQLRDELGRWADEGVSAGTGRIRVAGPSPLRGPARYGANFPVRHLDN